MRILRISPLLVAVLLSQITHAVAASCTTELVLAAVFGGLLALFLIILLLYCCIKRYRRKNRVPASTTSLVSSVEEGGSRRFVNPSMDLSVAEIELEERKREEHRLICSQCHQRMIRANIEMPTAIENSGMSTSEERLPVNGSFPSGSPSPVDEPRIFVFVEKKPGENLGLYLVPFEEEPLTGLYVKTIFSGKSAARLQVFDPGDKIVTVNGQSLSGLTYRESTDFIRQCPGPNVKMGIIKHALYKKEDLAKLESMSIYQRHSTSNLEVESPELNIGGSASLGFGAHASAARLSGPKANLDGGEASKELVIEAPLTVAKPDISYDVESTPDTFMDMDSFGIGGKSDHDFNLSGGGSGSADIDTNANMAGKSEIPGGDMEIDFSAPVGIFGDADVPALGASATTEEMDSDSSVENHPPKTKRRKSSKGCRRSRSNPQIRPQYLAELAVDTRSGIPPRHSPDQYRSTGKEFAIGSEYYSPPAVFRAGNLCAVAGPLNQRSPADSRNFLPSYLVPLSDPPSSSYWMGNAGMIKSKSLDKLDEIMRNDPILRDDYLGASSSKSTQTQTDTVYSKKKPRRKRNDRPRSQILPPTYLQLPSVTWFPNELGSNETSKETTQANESSEVRNDYYLGPNFSHTTHRRKSKEEQAQIVQRWINEMIEHKRTQELRRQSLVRQSLGRERSTKLKKKSRSVPEHAFRGNQSRFERRRSTDDSKEINWQYGIPEAKLKHSGSDPSFKSPVCRDDRHLSVSTSSIGAASRQIVGTSTVTDEKISPSLQSRIRYLEKSLQQNNTSGSSLKSNNNNWDLAKSLGRNGSESSPRLVRRTRASNPDTPLISLLLSGGKLDSQC